MIPVVCRWRPRGVWTVLCTAVGAQPDVAEKAARRAEEANREMWALPN
ncbi:hypothetical protein ABIB34_001765 [Rhodococcus sp. UYP5]